MEVGDILRLAQNQTVLERPFTCPDHIAVDKAVLNIMIREVCKHLPDTDGTAPYTYHYPTEQNWQKRVLLTRLSALPCGTPITVVGFFGKRRFPVAQEICTQIVEFGRAFERQIPQMPAILCYYTWLLSDELNYANLVLLQNQEAISQWQASRPHDLVKEDLSAQYYDCVRIYNGRLTLQRPTQTHQLTLERVKYFDYRVQPTWRAVRELTDVAVE